MGKNLLSKGKEKLKSAGKDLLTKGKAKLKSAAKDAYAKGKAKLKSAGQELIKKGAKAAGKAAGDLTKKAGNAALKFGKNISDKAIDKLGKDTFAGKLASKAQKKALAAGGKLVDKSSKKAAKLASDLTSKAGRAALKKGEQLADKGAKKVADKFNSLGKGKEKKTKEGKEKKSKAGKEPKTKEGKEKSTKEGKEKKTKQTKEKKTKETKEKKTKEGKEKKTKEGKEKKTKEGKEKSAKTEKKDKKSPLRPGVSCPISFIEYGSLIEMELLAPVLTPAEANYCAEQRAAYLAKKRADDPEPGVSPKSLNQNSGSVTVAALPLDAKVDMMMNDISYRVKAQQKEALKKKQSSKSLWEKEIATTADEFKGTELEEPLRQMRVEKSSFDQAITSIPGEKPGKREIYAGGHGSASTADWLGQNLQMSRLPGAVRGALNAVGMKGLASKVPDIQMRGDRLAADTNAVINRPDMKGNVEKVNVFGHSMSGYQGHRAADKLIASNPDIPVEAYLLNPGGAGAKRQKATPGVTNVVIPGEVLSRVGLGNKDKVELDLQNADAQAAKGIGGTIYLHSNGRVMDDIRQFEGVKARDD